MQKCKCVLSIFILVVLIISLAVYIAISVNNIVVKSREKYKFVHTELRTGKWHNLANRVFPETRFLTDAGITSSTGIALTGGGVRAASIALGLLQSLDHAGLLSRQSIQYISTVSGSSWSTFPILYTFDTEKRRSLIGSRVDSAEPFDAAVGRDTMAYAISNLKFSLTSSWNESIKNTFFATCDMQEYASRSAANGLPIPMCTQTMWMPSGEMVVVDSTPLSTGTLLPENETRVSGRCDSESFISNIQYPKRGSAFNSDIDEFLFSGSQWTPDRMSSSSSALDYSLLGKKLISNVQPSLKHVVMNDTREIRIGDGGYIDPTATVSLLARKVQKIVMVDNTNYSNLFEAFDIANARVGDHVFFVNDSVRVMPEILRIAGIDAEKTYIYVQTSPKSVGGAQYKRVKADELGFLKNITFNNFRNMFVEPNQEKIVSVFQGGADRFKQIAAEIQNTYFETGVMSHTAYLATKKVDWLGVEEYTPEVLYIFVFNCPSAVAMLSPNNQNLVMNIANGVNLCTINPYKSDCGIYKECKAKCDAYSNYDVLFNADKLQKMSPTQLRYIMYTTDFLATHAILNFLQRTF
jgi:hypothetical protein